MRMVVAAVLAVVAARPVAAQDAPPYTPVENPYQAEFAFVPGKPIDLHVTIDGIHLDTLTFSTPEQPRAGSQAPCAVELSGSSVAERKATLAVAVLLEDNGGVGLGRAVLDPFKVKPGRTFDEKQRRELPGDALVAAKKLYIMVEVSF